jgi:hypothetical protein
MGDFAVLVIVSVAAAAAIQSRREPYILGAIAAYTATTMYLVLTTMTMARYAMVVAVLLALHGLVVMVLQAISEAGIRRQRAGIDAANAPLVDRRNGPARNAGQKSADSASASESVR